MRRACSAVVLAFVAAGACAHDARPDGSNAPRRECGLDVWYRPSSPSAQVEVVASWNGWKRPGPMLTKQRDDGFRYAHFDVSAGEQEYAIVDDGVFMNNPYVATSGFHDGREVTWVRAPRCDVPLLRIEEVTASADGTATVRARFLAASSGSPIDPQSALIATRDGATQPIGAERIDTSSGAITLPLVGLATGKYRFAFRARDSDGRDAEEASATVWIESRPFDLRDSVLYQVIIDRFRNAEGALAPPSTASMRAGGDLRGILAAIESGELGALGVNTLWLSPLYANPTGTYPGADGKPYSSYHGYWPITPRSIEPLLGHDADLDAVVSAAHRRGMRVLFDVVPNHVHTEHPYFRDHLKDGWFNGPDGSCVCGSTQCPWETHIEDCWFTAYLPDLDWRNPDVATQGTDDVLFWLDRHDADGIRIDAVPMMPRAATRRIVSSIRERFEHPGQHLLLLGENYTGPNGFDLLRYQLGPFGLDSQFHFPLTWALRRSIATSATTMRDVAAVLDEGERTWAGSGAVMATMTSNHDMTRFASESAGDAAGDPWSPPPQPTSALVYAKQRLAVGLVLTLPGAPVLYYGEEVALAGRGDPDCRRVLPPADALSADQRATREHVRRVGTLRACDEALRRGTYRLLGVDDEHLVFSRETASETAIVVATRNASTAVTTTISGVPAGDYVDALSGRRQHLDTATTTVATASYELAVFLPTASPCLR